MIFCYDNTICVDNIIKLIKMIGETLIDRYDLRNNKENIYKEVQSLKQNLENNKTKEKIEQQLILSYNCLKKNN